MENIWEEKHHRIDNQYEHHYIETKNVKWHYVEYGNPNGVPVILVHGLPECWYSWYKVAPLLNQEYRIIVIDNKGQGRSVAYNDNFEWHNIAKEMIEFIDALNIKKFHVVGHDWGSIITSILVGDYPERILSYVRMEADLFQPKDKANTYTKKPQWLIFNNERFGRWFLDKTASNGIFTKICYKSKKVKRVLNPISDDEYAYLTYEFKRENVGINAAKYFLPKNRDMDGMFDKIAFNNFDFPVIALQADSDPSQPKEIFKDIDKCKNVELIWIKDASHFSNLDQPQQVAKAINTVLERVKQ